ncbi:TrmH family RNA methyltransferase [Aeromicrobium sp. CF4.19]|uniref:TrmH family RNA methyltransferase n=1 Tax=Aeromicrobium sp. CF4.19 TaxID=3373082 RepID=UPI003EE78EE1
MASPEPLTVRSGRVRHARRLATRAFRDKTGEFLAEGPQAVREALGVPGLVLEVFATVEAGERHVALRERAATGSTPWSVVDDEVLAEVADSTTPQGLVARCTSVVAGLDAVPPAARLVVVCADMRDPGNAGAVIRCADAAGADAVVLAGDSVDPTNPKAVRASAGSLFHLPVVVHRDLGEVVELLQGRGLQVLAADGRGDVGLFEETLDLAAPTAWLMGNEAHGLAEAARGLADQVVAVPIHGRAESLNLATAAAVCLYASARDQRAAGGGLPGAQPGDSRPSA